MPGSSPNWTAGYVPPASEWNQWWGNKADYLQVGFFTDASSFIQSADAGDFGLAINRAIAAAEAAGGGFITIQPGAYNIATSVVITTSNIRILGAGRGGTHDTNPVETAATTLTWTGANGGTMILIAPPTSGQRIVGWGIEGVALVSGVYPYSSAAAIAIRASSCAYGDINVTTVEFTGQAVITTGVSALPENSLFQWNRIDIIARQINTPGTILQMGGYSGGLVNNSCFNKVRLYGEYNNGIGIDLQNADNNRFYEVYLQRAGGGTGEPMIMRGGTVAEPGYARNNIFYDYSQSTGSGTIISEGTGAYGPRTVTQPAVQNQIVFWDTSNAAASVSVGTGSTFWVGGNTLPVGVGFESYTVSPATGARLDTAMIGEVWGIFTAGGAGTTTISVVGSGNPTPAHGVQNVQLTALQTGTPAYPQTFSTSSFQIVAPGAGSWMWRALVI